MDCETAKEPEFYGTLPLYKINRDAMIPVAHQDEDGTWHWDLSAADYGRFFALRAKGAIITAQRRESDGYYTLLAKRTQHTVPDWVRHVELPVSSPTT